VANKTFAAGFAVAVLLKIQNKNLSAMKKKSLIEKLLVERISLRGICRETGVSLPFLLDFQKKCSGEVPEDLGVEPTVKRISLQANEVEKDVYR
jgi:hypothetical protein